MKWLKKVAATPLTTIARVVDNLNVQTIIKYTKN